MNLTKLVIEDFQISKDFSLLKFNARICKESGVAMVDLVYVDDQCVEHSLTTTLSSVVSQETLRRLNEKDDYEIIDSILSRIENGDEIKVEPEESIVILRNVSVDEAEWEVGYEEDDKKPKLIVEGTIYHPGTSPGCMNFIKIRFFNDGWRVSKN